MDGGGGMGCGAYRWSRRARSGWTWPSACRRRAWTAAARPRRPGRLPCTRRPRRRPPVAGAGAAPPQPPTQMPMPPAHASSSCARGLCLAKPALLAALCLCWLYLSMRGWQRQSAESVRLHAPRLGSDHVFRPESPVLPTAAVSLITSADGFGSSIDGRGPLGRGLLGSASASGVQSRARHVGL